MYIGSLAVQARLITSRDCTWHCREVRFLAGMPKGWASCIPCAVSSWPTMTEEEI